jgi:serine/threonine protein kinase
MNLSVPVSLTVLPPPSEDVPLMDPTFTQSRSPRPLSELLAEGLGWSLKDRLLLVRRLAVQVGSLHQAGRTHRAIATEGVAVDERLRPQLGPPAGPRSFGADDPDPEFCPPKLSEAEDLVLAEDIDSATASLTARKLDLDPRSVDVYQLGVLLCRLVTGQSILQYMYSPTAKAKVPSFVRSLLDRALGHSAADRFPSCEPLIEALDGALRLADSMHTPTAAHETPAAGSVHGENDSTPSGGERPEIAQSDTPRASETLPFERLGHYRIIRRVGRGGMGDVYQAHDESLDRPVAVKVLPPELARDESFVGRFHAEATAAAKVVHPNIVPVYSIGQDAGHHFFAMQLVEGESLAERLARQQRLPWNEALKIVRQCLAGLEAIHAQGLIHRDIKPSNVLIDRRTGRAMLVDFGIVRRIDEGTRRTATGTIMGTVDYIAPEQARGRKVDARADLYALGVLFYRLLAGRLPFEADTPTAMMFQHAYERPFPLQKAAPEVPQPLADVVARMTAKNPNHRYLSCAAVLTDLQALLEGRPVTASLGGRWTRLRAQMASQLDVHTPTFLRALRASWTAIVTVLGWAALWMLTHGPWLLKHLSNALRACKIAGRWVAETVPKWFPPWVRSRAKSCFKYVCRITFRVTCAVCGWMAAQFCAYAPGFFKQLVSLTQRAAEAVRDWTFFRLTWHGPAFVRSLQNTAHQVDHAVAEYEARRKAMAGLLDEARKLKADLTEQIEANRQAAIEAARLMTSSAEEDDLQSALAQQHQSEQAVASLRTQHDQQQRYVEELEHKLTKADATLARLRSQRDVLGARLHAAQARLTIEAAHPPKGEDRALPPK